VDFIVMLANLLVVGVEGVLVGHLEFTVPDGPVRTTFVRI
jgi:hypothetical protein